MVQFFDRPRLIEDIGYRVVRGVLEQGEEVTVERDPETHPDFFNRLLTHDDALQCVVFDNADQQAEWVALEIQRNLTTDELQKSDILVVFLDSRGAKSEAGRLMAALSRLEVPSHLVGVTTGPDSVFDKDSVAMSGVFRAKGNEAAMVYVLDSHYGFSGLELTKRRNALFTAMTRSRAWVRVCGYGEPMKGLQEELSAIVQANFQLTFQVPTSEQLRRLRKAHRERTSGEMKEIQRDFKGIRNVLSRIESGELSAEDLPPEFQELLQQVTRAIEGDDEEDDL